MGTSGRHFAEEIRVSTRYCCFKAADKSALSPLTDWKHMTLVLQRWEIFRRGGSPWKNSSAGCKTLGVDPCCLELIENRNYPPALTSRVSRASGQVFIRKQYVTMRGSCGNPCAHTHTHTQTRFEKWSEWTNISAAVKCSSLTTAIHLPETPHAPQHHSFPTLGAR